MGLTNASETQVGDYDESRLHAEGMSDEMLREASKQNVGIVVLAEPRDTIDAMVEAGLTIVLVKDEPSACTEGPHSHAADRSPIAAGRITYQKALNLASALVGMAANIIPMDSHEQDVVARINAAMAEAIEAAERHSHTESEGGHAVNII